METDAQTMREAPPLPKPPASPFRRSPTMLALVILVAILIALALAEAVLLVRGDSAEEGRSEVLQTSQRFLVQLTTYNFDTIETQRTEVLKLAAGRFRNEYSTLVDPTFIQRLRETQADSKGRVVRLAVTSVSGDNAETLAIVEVTIRNKNRPAPLVEQNVMELTLVRTGSGWRIDSVTIVGTVG